MATQAKESRRWIEIDDVTGDFIQVQTSRTLIGKADDLLAKLASDYPVTLKAVSDIDGVVLNLSFKQPYYTIWGIIPGVVLNGCWENHSGVLTPLFGGSSPIELALKWLAPETMKIYFIVLADKPNVSFRLNNAYMVALSTDVSVKGWRMLPLANTYETGRLCLGSGRPQTAPSITSLWAGCLAHYSKAPFNADLNTSFILSNAPQMFRFDAGTSRQMDVPKNWDKYCPMVNDTAYSVIPV